MPWDNFAGCGEGWGSGRVHLGRIAEYPGWEYCPPLVILSTMGSQLQSYAALGIVLVAVVWLAWYYLGGKKKPGCGGDCGCATDKFKEKLKR